jgi:peptide chain release factor 2
MQIQYLEHKILEQNFWNNTKNAINTINILNNLKDICTSWHTLNAQIDYLKELKILAENDYDEQLLQEIQGTTKKFEQDLFLFEIKAKLNDNYNKHNAIISIHAGAGGTESCDWAQMLIRMYSRWAERKHFKISIVNTLNGDESGIKSATLIIKGEHVYTLLQSEIGVHRLIRISPFDSNKRRHTSFCSVDVIPEVENDINVTIKDKDIRIDTYRSSGAGGQHVNKTDSAVRITHLETGIVVQSQNERSQSQNKMIAMKLLKSKLSKLELDKQLSNYEKHYNSQSSIQWGNQIRSYIFMPYKLVKDHRTGYEMTQVDLVINGDIDKFINSYLAWKLNNL